MIYGNYTNKIIRSKIQKMNTQELDNYLAELLKCYPLGDAPYHRHIMQLKQFREELLSCIYRNVYQQTFSRLNCDTKFVNGVRPFQKK